MPGVQELEFEPLFATLYREKCRQSFVNLLLLMLKDNKRKFESAGLKNLFRSLDCDFDGLLCL